MRRESNAVVVCIMDTSGSMDTMKKYLARSFFFLLYQFICSERPYKSERPSTNIMLRGPREKALRKYYQLRSVTYERVQSYAAKRSRSFHCD
jgi:hypothetical protein